MHAVCQSEGAAAGGGGMGRHPLRDRRQQGSYPVSGATARARRGRPLPPPYPLPTGVAVRKDFGLHGAQND